tara:strand:+ start:942 stop:1178 length:237 start_codon:yes stop_codon:yes gene_type:complete
MKNFIISVEKNKNIYHVEKDSYFYIIENVNEYKEEICSLIEENKMSYELLKNQIESWGGSIKLISLKELINIYHKSLF